MAMKKHNPQCAKQLAASNPNSQTVVNTVCVGTLSLSLRHNHVHMHAITVQADRPSQTIHF